MAQLAPTLLSQFSTVRSFCWLLLELVLMHRDAQAELYDNITQDELDLMFAPPAAPNAAPDNQGRYRLTLGEARALKLHVLSPLPPNTHRISSMTATNTHDIEASKLTLSRSPSSSLQSSAAKQIEHSSGIQACSSARLIQTAQRRTCVNSGQSAD